MEDSWNFYSFLLLFPLIGGHSPYKNHKQLTLPHGPYFLWSHAANSSNFYPPAALRTASARGLSNVSCQIEAGLSASTAAPIYGRNIYSIPFPLDETKKKTGRCTLNTTNELCAALQSEQIVDGECILFINGACGVSQGWDLLISCHCHHLKNSARENLKPDHSSFIGSRKSHTITMSLVLVLIILLIFVFKYYFQSLPRCCGLLNG